MTHDDDAVAITSLLSAADSRHSQPTVRSAELARWQQDPRTAVGEHDIVCLLCGTAFRQLTNTHLLVHGLSSIAYKRRFGYNLGRPLMSHALRRLYAERARETGLATRIRRRPIIAEPELRRRGGARPIMLEDFLTRCEIQRQPRRRWNIRDKRGRFAAGVPETRLPGSAVLQSDLTQA